MGNFKFFRGYISEGDQINNWVAQNVPLNPVTRVEPPPRFPINRFEPMRENRYLVVFPEQFQIDNFFVKSTLRPSVQVVEGRGIWNDIVIKFHDPIGQPLQNSLFCLMNNMNLEEHEIKMQMLDPVGDVVSEWIIYGVIKEISFGELDYGSDEPTEPTMIIGVNRALLNF